ncbi:FtsX-like permease family protein [Seonamhaeicola marinus]|uniref:FtsX-like permease family protein n=1 Tax=Seonamhaeicola marinus TaxID=1912246 RepID=UPI001FE60214|nr:FtsX-like permease family protein [Seonamhaeicola marinus]
MNIWKISIKNLKSKPFYTFLSIITLALSITLLLGIKQLKSSFKYQMDNNLGNIDLVIGAKGSPLQLVLASILHLDNPTGNISYNEANKLAKNPLIKSAVPISYGDNYKGYRIVGTTPEFYSFYDAELEKGNFPKVSMDVVVGSKVAEQLHLNIGDTFLSSHGLVENTIDVHEDVLTVVGILKPTQKVIDRLIVTNLQSVWDVHDHGDHEGHTEEHKNEDVGSNDHEAHKDEHEHHDGEAHDHEAHKDEHEHHDAEAHDHEAHKDEHEHHDAEAHDHEAHKDEHEHHDGEAHDHEAHKDEHEHHDDEAHDHDEEKEITSLLITFRSPAALLTFPRKVNEDSNFQAAIPRYELDRLYEFTSVGFKTITWIAYLILIISGFTIFINLYKMVKERAFDLALLRTYGASNFQIIKMVAYEAFSIALVAFLLGFLLVKAALFLILNFSNLGNKQNMIQELGIQDILYTGVLVLIMVTLSLILAIYPILRMNISTILSNEK